MTYQSDESMRLNETKQNETKRNERSIMQISLTIEIQINCDRIAETIRPPSVRRRPPTSEGRLSVYGTVAFVIVK